MSYFGKDFLENIASGGYSNVVPWSKMGYSPAIGTTSATTQSDIWSAGGLYVFPTAATAMAVIGGANDDGTDTFSTTYAGTDNGGSATALKDTTKDFTTPTTAAIGDCVILDKAGTTPEWGYVTGLTGTNQLDVASGFSSGGNANGRAYTVIDKSASTGAQAVKIGYLDSTYAAKEEIVVTNGAAEVNLTGSPLRINSFRVIAAGSTNAAVGALSLKAQTPTATVYSYITAGYTRARNAMYTVPLGKTLYVISTHMSYGVSAATKSEYARLWVKANLVDQTGFLMNNIFWSYIETVCSNNSASLLLPVYAKLPQKTDIKVTGVASAVGNSTVVMRGYLTTP
jgi:hypothetical protein